MAAELTRDQHADVFTGAIIVSGLIGAIWQVRDNLSFNVGLRHAITNGVHANEIRAGLTFGFSLQRLGGPAHK